MSRQSLAFGVGILVLGGLAVLLSWRLSDQPSFPEPPMGYRNEKVNMRGPRYPDVPPQSVPHVDLVVDLQPAALGPWTGEANSPVVLTGTVRLPEWTWGDQVPIFITVKDIRTTRSARSLLRSSGSHTFLSDKDGLCQYRLEFRAPEQPGQYPIQFTVQHSGYEPLGFTAENPPTPEQALAAQITEVFATGTLIVVPAAGQ